MNKKTTPQNIASEKTPEENLGPTQMTVAFIKQFARTYVFEPRLPQKLNSYVVN